MKKIEYDGSTRCEIVEINTNAKSTTMASCFKYFMKSIKNVFQQNQVMNLYVGTGLTDKEICDFTVKSNTNKKCEPRAKICNDYSSDAKTCNAKENCAYIESWRRCIPIESNDDNCEKKANGECSAKEGKASSFSEYEKCGYVKKDDKDKDNTYKSQKSYK